MTTRWNVTVRGFKSEAQAQHFLERAMTEALHMGTYHHLKADLGRQVDTSDVVPIRAPSKAAAAARRRSNRR